WREVFRGCPPLRVRINSATLRATVTVFDRVSTSGALRHFPPRSCSRGFGPVGGLAILLARPSDSADANSLSWIWGTRRRKGIQINCKVRLLTRVVDGSRSLYPRVAFNNLRFEPFVDFALDPTNAILPDLNWGRKFSHFHQATDVNARIEDAALAQIL